MSTSVALSPLGNVTAQLFLTVGAQSERVVGKQSAVNSRYALKGRIGRRVLRGTETPVGAGRAGAWIHPREKLGEFSLAVWHGPVIESLSLQDSCEEEQSPLPRLQGEWVPSGLGTE